MKIGLIGYEVPHRKVLEIAFGLQESGHDVVIFGFPFKPRISTNQPIFRDRPEPIMHFALENYLKGSGLEYVCCNGWNEVCQYKFNEAASVCDYIITCIAKIIPTQMVVNNIILNSHPGMLPYNRGVDAFKRAIINRWPIGVTLHRIDESIDAGIIIKSVNVPVFPDDSLDIVCDRAFNLEIRLLIESSQYISAEYIADTARSQSALCHTLYKNKIDSKQEGKIRELFRENIDVFIDHFKKQRKNVSEFK